MWVSIEGKNVVELVRAQSLARVPHGFAERRGGVSTGLYAGLNVGSGSDDDPGAVRRNRDLVRDAVLPGSTLVTVHQIHSPDVVTVRAAIADEAYCRLEQHRRHRFGAADPPLRPVLLTEREACLRELLWVGVAPEVGDHERVGHDEVRLEDRPEHPR